MVSESEDDNQSTTTTKSDIDLFVQYLDETIETNHVSLAELESIFFQFVARHESIASQSDRTLLTSSIVSYVAERFGAITDRLCTTAGTLNRNLRVIPIRDEANLLKTYLEEFVLARRHLSADENAQVVSATFNPLTFGEHHVDSYNAFLNKYAMDLLHRQEDIVCFETARNVQDAIAFVESVVLERDVENQCTESAHKIAQKCNQLEAVAHDMLWTIKRSSNEDFDSFKARVLEILYLQQKHWNDDVGSDTNKQRRGRHYEHRLALQGISYGPATSMDHPDEGWPSHPKEAKVINSTMYGAAQYLQVCYTCTNLDSKITEHTETMNIPICHVPVLVQSILCATSRMPRDIQEIVGEDYDDKVCYLIVKGYERIYTTMERRLVNHTLVFERNKQLEAQARCTQECDLEGGSSIYVCYPLPNNHHAFNNNNKSSAPSILSVLLPISSEQQPVTVLFAAFGVTDKQTIKEMILQDFHDPVTKQKAEAALRDTWSALPQIFSPQFELSEQAKECGAINNIQEAAWRYFLDMISSGSDAAANESYLSFRRGVPHWENSAHKNTNPYNKLLHFLSTFYINIGNLNPDHPKKKLPTASIWVQKIAYLSHQCSRLLAVLLKIDPQDRHCYGGNKRLGAVGRALHREWGELFDREVYQKLKHELRAAVDTHQFLNLKGLQINFTDALRKTITAQKRERVSNTGSKSSKEDRNAQTCLSQQLDRTNAVCAKSHVRATDAPVERSGRNPHTRRLDHSTFGKYCTDETPDSENVGLSSHLALCARIPTYGNAWPLLRLLMCHFQAPDFIPLHETKLLSEYKHIPSCLVFLDKNIPVGRTTNPAKIVALLMKLRRGCFGFRDMGIVATLSPNKIGAVYQHHEFPETRFARFCYDELDAICTEKKNESEKSQKGGANRNKNKMSVDEKEGQPVEDLKNSYLDCSIAPASVLYAASLVIFTDPGRLLSPYYIVDPDERTVRFDRNTFSLVKNNPTINMEWLVANGYVEYLGVQEEDQSLLADFPHDMIHTDVLQRMNLVMRPNKTQCRLYSHCQLHPTTMKGLVANTIPRSDHSHGPRNLYASTQGRHQISCPGMYHLENCESYMRIVYPQTPLAQTLGGELIRDEEFGQTCIQNVAVLCFRGRTIEDSYPISRRLVEQQHTGMILNRGYVGTIQSDSGTKQTFENPVLTRKAKPNPRYDYSSLREDGLPAIGTRIDGQAPTRHVVFNRVSQYIVSTKTSNATSVPSTTTDSINVEQTQHQQVEHTNHAGVEITTTITTKSAKTKKQNAKKETAATAAKKKLAKKTTTPQKQTVTAFKSIPEPARRGDIGYVTMVERRSLRGFKREIVRIKTSHHHTIEEGDKLSTQEGHKVTISATVPEKELCYTRSGKQIDGFIDPTFPMNRMVCNQMIEGRCNVVTLYSGKRVRMINFGPNLDWYIRSVLLKNGESPELCETMYNGTTGEMLKSPVVVLVINSMFLRYLSSLKLAAQSQTPRSTLTNQPVDGKARGGGTRFGEMERQCEEGYGCGREEHDNAVTHGSKNLVVYCAKCRRKATFHRELQKMWCQSCQSGAHVYLDEQQYSVMLAEHILRGQGIGMRYRVEPRTTPLYILKSAPPVPMNVC